VPEDVDDGFAAIRIAEVLNVSALEVPHLPPLWIRNAVIYLKVQHMQQERAARAAQKRSAASQRPKRPQR
jgi:hypothetical protein